MRVADKSFKPGILAMSLFNWWIRAICVEWTNDSLPILELDSNVLLNKKPRNTTQWPQKTRLKTLDRIIQ